MAAVSEPFLNLKDEASLKNKLMAVVVGGTAVHCGGVINVVFMRAISEEMGLGNWGYTHWLSSPCRNYAILSTSYLKAT